MAPRKSELASLRAQVLKRQRDVGRKVSRLGRQGVDVGGTNFDPRRAPENVNRYSERQLRAQLGRLDRFMDRKTQFVGDAKRRPIPRAEWEPFARVQNQYRKFVAARDAGIKDARLPWGETVADRQETLTDRSRRRNTRKNNPSARRTHDFIERKPEHIADRNALKTLTRDLKKRMTPKWDREQREKNRDELRQIFEGFNGSKDFDLERDIAALSNRQFDLLWGDTPFATAASLIYEQIQKMLAGKDAASAQEIIDANAAEAKRLVEWVKNQPADEPETKGSTKGKGKDRNGKGYRGKGRKTK